MRASTRELWDRQNRHPGDRASLFRAVGDAVGGTRVLYPGSYVDIAASVAWPSVTYVDVDRRAAGFFDDASGVTELIIEQGGRPDSAVIFLHADYTGDLPLRDESFDVLVSLYAGFVSEACTRFLRVGGVLLVNPSHGDVAMASIDRRYELCGVVTAHSGRYRVRTGGLDEYLVPTVLVDLTVDSVRKRGRGIAYTKPAFAYLFRRIA